MVLKKWSRAKVIKSVIKSPSSAKSGKLSVQNVSGGIDVWCNCGLQSNANGSGSVIDPKRQKKKKN
jgi:hypothetical protein